MKKIEIIESDDGSFEVKYYEKDKDEWVEKVDGINPAQIHRYSMIAAKKLRKDPRIKE